MPSSPGSTVGRAAPPTSPPAADVIARLKALVRETQERYGQPATAREREATRLADQRFEHTIDTPHGTLPLYALDLPCVPLPASLPAPLAAVWAVRPELRDVVAIDIETAATVGGSRDVPFVIGLARHAAGALRLEQLLLRGLEDEPAALWAIDERVAGASHVLTYNGSRFDIPLLARRSRAVRHEPFAPPCDVVDLEPFARAAFGRGGLSSTLASLEERVLSSVRPAWTWHPIWREEGGLSWRRRRHLARILAKNGQDTLSLLVLLGAECDLVERPGGNPGACIFIGRGLAASDPREAARWYERAAEGPLDDERIGAALAAWRLDASAQSRLTPVLARAALSDHATAWMAAERLGLAAWQSGDREEAARWTERAMRGATTARDRARCAARLRRWGGIQA